jgi:hypothetical protein
MLRKESPRLLTRHAPVPTPCHDDWIPLDVDVSPFGTTRVHSFTYNKPLYGFQFKAARPLCEKQAVFPKTDAQFETRSRITY